MDTMSGGLGFAIQVFYTKLCIIPAAKVWRSSDLGMYRNMSDKKQQKINFIQKGCRLIFEHSHHVMDNNRFHNKSLLGPLKGMIAWSV